MRNTIIVGLALIGVAVAVAVVAGACPMRASRKATRNAWAQATDKVS